MSCDLYETIEDELSRSYRRFLRRRTVSRIDWAFGRGKWWLRDETTRAGLARVVRSVRRGVLSGRPEAPWGWRARKIESRDAYEVLPLWLYWLTEAPWVLFPILRKLGLWRTREEGGLWIEGHPSAPRWLERMVWCFVHDRDAHWTRGASQRTRQKWEYGIDVGEPS